MRGEEEGGEDWEREEGKLTVILLKNQLSTSTINTKGIKIMYNYTSTCTCRY